MLDRAVTYSLTEEHNATVTRKRLVSRKAVATHRATSNLALSCHYTLFQLHQSKHVIRKSRSVAVVAVVIAATTTMATTTSVRDAKHRFPAG